ncbi:hypothetical protein [Capnocytophaga granulosa]
MNFIHGHLKLQDVSLYIHTATIFALSIEEGEHTRNSYVWE